MDKRREMFEDWFEREYVNHNFGYSKLDMFAAWQAALAIQWHTIETAPKDGQAILVSDGMFRHCVEWNDEFDWWAVDDNKLGPFRLRGAAPTHWQPLPPEPTT